MRIKLVFQSIDTNNDGGLSEKELKAASTKLKRLNFSQWKDVLQKCDLDGDGQIDFHEFFTAAVNHKKSVTRESIDWAFETFDANGDG